MGDRTARRLLQTGLQSLAYIQQSCHTQFNWHCVVFGVEKVHVLTSDIVPVSLVNRVLLPTEGNPTRPTLASPTLLTSNPVEAC